MIAGWIGVLLLTPAVAHGLTSVPTGPAEGLEITGSAVRGTPLFPGRTGDITFTVRNRKDHPVRVDTARLTGVTATSAPGCSGDHFTLPGGVVRSVTLDPGASATVVVVGGIAMDRTAPEACQGVTISVAATLSGSPA